jgi:hypothetical protein
MLRSIKEDLKKRMAGYHDSRHPTDDEVRIAWLLREVETLGKLVTLARDEYLKANSDGETDCVTPYDTYT